MQIIEGKRYNTETSTLLAQNGYRHNSIYGTQLYATKKNNFFFYHWSNMQGETDSIEPISEMIEAFEFYCKNWFRSLEDTEEFEKLRKQYFAKYQIEDA